MMMTKSAQRKTNRWLDVQIVITTLAMTFTLYLWNLFAGQAPQVVEASGQASNLEMENLVNAEAEGTVVTVIPTAVPTQAPARVSGPIFFGGAAPQAGPVVSNGSSSQAVQPAAAPVIVTNTRSSK